MDSSRSRNVLWTYSRNSKLAEKRIQEHCSQCNAVASMPHIKLGTQNREKSEQREGIKISSLKGKGQWTIHQIIKVSCKRNRWKSSDRWYLWGDEKTSWSYPPPLLECHASSIWDSICNGFHIKSSPFKLAWIFTREEEDKKAEQNNHICCTINA